MDVLTTKKWDRASAAFDLMNAFGAERRWAPTKREFFSAMRGQVLFVAVGTGLDIPHFPPEGDIVGIDISDGMLAKARARAAAYRGRLELRQLDVHEMDYSPGTFDQVFTSCTFCSVPRPVDGLRALRRVLKPDGELHMFEHTGSRWFPISVMMHLMTQLSRRLGPEMNRDTPSNVERAGYELLKVSPVYLDVVKTIHARSPGPP